MQSRVTPYVVEVDSLGEARAVTEAEAEYQPTDPQIAWHLARFITDVRGRSLDPVLMRENWLEAYDFATKRGAQFLGDYARSADPFADVGERDGLGPGDQRGPRVRPILPGEVVRDRLRAREPQAGTSRWTAILTVLLAAAGHADTLRKNPLGLYVDAIDWSRELDPCAASPRPARAAPNSATNLPARIAARSESGRSSPSPKGDPVHEPHPRLSAIALSIGDANAQTSPPPPLRRVPARRRSRPKVAPPSRSAPPSSLQATNRRRRKLRGSHANRAATQEPATPAFLNAVQVYALWRRVDVSGLSPRPSVVTDIALQPGEAIVSVAAGDTAAGHRRHHQR
jgi:hypothetical protein